MRQVEVSADRSLSPPRVAQRLSRRILLRSGLQAAAAITLARPLAELGQVVLDAAPPWAAYPARRTAGHYVSAGESAPAATADKAADKAPEVAAKDAKPTADLLIVGKDRRLLVHNPARTGFEI